MSIIRWINEQDAAKHVDRSPRTLRAWRQAGDLIAHNQGQRGVMYLIDSLEECKRVQAERYRNRPNPGRPPNNP